MPYSHISPRVWVFVCKSFKYSVLVTIYIIISSTRTDCRLCSQQTPNEMSQSLYPKKLLLSTLMPKATTIFKYDNAFNLTIICSSTCYPKDVISRRCTTTLMNILCGASMNLLSHLKWVIHKMVIEVKCHYDKLQERKFR